MRQDASHARSRAAVSFAIASALVLAAAVMSPAMAAKVYRCGNVFQDQPCPEVKIAAATPASERGVGATRDVSCATPSRDAARSDCKSAAPREPVVEAKR